MQRVSPMATSPHDPDVLYYGSQYVHRTRDKGVTWEKISPDLTAHPDVLPGRQRRADHARRHGRRVLQHALCDHRVAAREGRDLDRIERRSVLRHARQRQDVDERHAEGSAARRARAVHRSVAASQGLGVLRGLSLAARRLSPYIYRTDDYGKTWTRLTDGKNGIPADWPTRVVREDPDREGLLYAGTEFGMFISFDNGAHWQPFQLNLPNVPVTDIKVHHKDLIVSTQGRAFWILDNLTPLHQLSSQMTTPRAVLNSYNSEHRVLRPGRGGPGRKHAGRRYCWSGITT
jgi:hypothetical protein